MAKGSQLLVAREQAGKGEPAVGGPGKGEYIVYNRRPLHSTVLQVKADGTWHCRCGTCVSLAHIFAKLGHKHTAIRLYEYYNICRTLASKRERPWGSPARRQAADDRKREHGRYGHQEPEPEPTRH